MAGMAAIGERALVEGYALAGVTVFVAEDPGAVRRAWRALAPDVGVVVLTAAAASALDTLYDGGVGATGAPPMVAVLP